MDPDRYLLTFRVSLRAFSLAHSRVLVELRVLHNQPVAPRSLNGKELLQTFSQRPGDDEHLLVSPHVLLVAQLRRGAGYSGISNAKKRGAAEDRRGAGGRKRHREEAGLADRAVLVPG